MERMNLGLAGSCGTPQPRYSRYSVIFISCGMHSHSCMKPWYGQGVAQCIVAEYLLKYYPYEDFVVYEIGAGNGTLALNILDYIRDLWPWVYERTRYNIIEISGSLAKLQEKKLKDHPCVSITNKSIFHWDRREDSPCMFIAMEVIVSELSICQYGM